MMPVKYTQEQANFIRQQGSCIDAAWYHIPMFFKEVGENMFEVYEFEELPQYVKDTILAERKQHE